jgi:glutathione S-transferase
MILVIGNKNYSSWSLRPWIAMQVFGFRFDERRIPLYGPGAKDEILKSSPAGKVPVLIDGSTTVWDSLAISSTSPKRIPGSGRSTVPSAQRRARSRRKCTRAFRTCATT